MKWFRSIFFLLAIFLFAWQLYHNLPILTQWLHGLGIYAFIGFFMLYCVAVLLFVPIEPLAVASGVLFGLLYGFVLSLFSAVVSASLAFLISRYFGENRFTSKHLLIRQYLKRVNTLGWKTLAIARLTPFLPCAVVNYAYGMTRMKLSIFTLTNVVFFAPYKFLMTYTGACL